MLPLVTCAQPACGRLALQSLTLLCSSRVDMQNHSSLTCPVVPAVSWQPQHMSYGSNFKKANAGTDITT